MQYRLGVDTGGTFTDVALVSEQTGETFITKVPSTPDNSSIGVMNGVKQIISENKINSKDLSFFIHGSTVATNTLLEKKGAKTALITTKGFKDVIEIGRQTRPKLYEFRARRSKPLIQRNLRWEIDERINASGEIVKEITDNDIQSILQQITENQVDSLVICFINSFLNAENEKKVKEHILQEYPNLAITLSSDILPEIKEYERTSTATVNGYVMPKMKLYLRDLENALTELDISSDLYIMQSNGGVITTDTAVEMPVRTVLSGPAGGVIAGTDIAKQTGLQNLITIDMGGTSLDTALIENGVPQYTTNSKIDDFPINVPMVEMHTIGSGGGSIAWIDSGGALRVGPHSAGAVPGPVCYGKGGTEPTVSDANAILGRINPDAILGGRMEMDIENARRIMKEKIADPLSINVEKAAEGILKVVNANMVRGIRVISVEKGHDTRDFSLLAFGGAGPLHASDIAKELGSKNIIIPPNPGITCASGMLIADVRHDDVQSFISNTNQLNVDELNAVFEKLQRNAKENLKKQGFTDEKIQLRLSLDLKYKNQAYDLNISLNGNAIDQETIEQAMKNFHHTHEKIYGFNREDQPLETVNARVTSFGIIDKPENKSNSSDSSQHDITFKSRKVYFDGQYMDTKIVDRDSLLQNNKLVGPAIIEQLDSTIVIHPNQKATTDEFKNLIIENL
ncbi:hydantoinase/oxoprolinase family protein [Oceanobacillus jeddahense]|uniref:Hydantoinase/oxoprolinase family protein n=1 Tax=Oceanobacillus jeddahense TaxID=1462527 RepID=A0ABY5JU28_9BACI|nr:hydantoinase/oxoprolinase family protein [Oceanobacillus jeddahense]UUI02982.1 hydantoinase/oxoprolinase family protein [Oceanobacillus jeddahense]